MRVGIGFQFGYRYSCRFRFLKKGLRFLDTYKNHPLVQTSFQPYREKTVRISIGWMKNHNAIVSILKGNTDPAIQADVSWLTNLSQEANGDSRSDRGVEVLAGLAALYLVCSAGGQSQREIDSYSSGLNRYSSRF
jgi:hypothetical protein